MEEMEYQNKLASLWPIDSDASREALALADEAVVAYPESPKLWCMRGDLIQLGSIESRYGLADALACYERAITVDPEFAEAYDSIGHFYDAVIPDSVKAQNAFRKAAMLKNNCK